jgi:MscS family membrane protein
LSLRGRAGILPRRRTMIIDLLNSVTTDHRLQALIVLLASFVLAFVTELLFRSVLVIFVQKTKTRLDDIVVANLRRPLFLSVLFLGTSWAASLLEPRDSLVFALNAALVSISIILWTGALIRISSAILRHVGDRPGATGVLQPRTLPLFDMLTKIMLFCAAVYLIMLACSLDVTGWLASAGIVGIAVGFAAKDSLANLFAGIFIIADSPYKLGDFIMFEDGMRGFVTEIGLRATRILTRDGIEINIPNQLIGNSRIVNESTGPHERERVRLSVAVAYGTDIDRVREVLLECPKGQLHICDEPGPHVQLEEFGASGPKFNLFVWIHHPRFLDDVVDLINTRIYKAFAANNLEIAHPKLDVFLKQLQTHLQTPLAAPDAAPAVHGLTQPAPPQTGAARHLPAG